MNSYKISRVPVVGGGKRERRTPFSQRIDELADNLKGFFAYNPGYEQEGPMQIAVSARADEGTYQYAPDKYAENILVSKTPRKGADFSSPALAHLVFPAAETSASAAIIPGPIMSGKKAKTIAAGFCSTTANSLLPKRRTRLWTG